MRSLTKSHRSLTSLLDMEGKARNPVVIIKKAVNELLKIKEIEDVYKIYCLEYEVLFDTDGKEFVLHYPRPILDKNQTIEKMTELLKTAGMYDHITQYVANCARNPQKILAPAQIIEQAANDLLDLKEGLIKYKVTDFKVSK